MKMTLEVANILYGPIKRRSIEWVYGVPNQLKGTNISFTERFLVNMIQLGKKQCTVRPLSGYRERVGRGTILHLFYHLRQPDCFKIADFVCMGRTKPIRTVDFTEELAVADGFRSKGHKTALDNMRLWFIERYHLKRGDMMEFTAIAWGTTPIKETLDRWFRSVKSE